MSYYNPTALPERTSLNVYAADIFNSSRQLLMGRYTRRRPHYDYCQAR
jgi:hypothetical protein